MCGVMGVKRRLAVAVQVSGRLGPTFVFQEFESFLRLARWHLGDDDEPLDSSHYEVIEGQQNLYFDFDGELDITTLADAIVQRYSLFEELYRKPLPVSIDLYSSCDSVKKSYHVVVKGVCFHDHIVCGRVAREVVDMASKVNPELGKSFDASVYTSKRNLRLLHSRKINSTRVKIFDGSVYRSPGYIAPKEDPVNRLLTSLVSYVIKCQCIGESATVKMPSPEIIETMSEDIVREALELVNERMPGVFYRREVRGRMLILNRNKPSMCCVCERVHDTDNAMVFLEHTSKGDTLIFRCYRDPSGNSVPLRCDEEVSLPDDTSKKSSRIPIFGAGRRAKAVPEAERKPDGVAELARKVVASYPFST
jgi:hypothetical protein